MSRAQEQQGRNGLGRHGFGVSVQGTDHGKGCSSIHWQAGHSPIWADMVLASIAKVHWVWGLVPETELGNSWGRVSLKKSPSRQNPRRVTVPLQEDHSYTLAGMAWTPCWRNGEGQADSPGTRWEGMGLGKGCKGANGKVQNPGKVAVQLAGRSVTHSVLS